MNPDHSSVSAGGRSGDSSQPLIVHITTIPMSLTFLRGQVGYMKEKGFAVVAVSSPGPDLWSFAEGERVRAVAVPMSRRITPFRDLVALFRLVVTLRRIRPTIVHAHTPKAGLLGMIAGAVSRVPVRIYHMRGLPLISATGWRRRLLRVTERLACRLAHQVLCVGRTIRSEALRESLCGAQKMSVLGNGSGNGVDAEGRFDPACLVPEAVSAVHRRFGIPEAAPVIGFVGRIVRDKGIVELVQAWRQLRDDHPEAHLLVVGPFEARDPVPQDTEEYLRNDPRVHLAGMDWNTPPLYASMSLVVLPTHREGFPNVPLEAAAMERPVVATKIPGCVEAIDDGVTGTLVPPGDVQALAGAIERYLMDPELRAVHGLAGRQRVLTRFRPELVWKDLHETYMRLLEPSARCLPVMSDGTGDFVA